MQNSFKLHSPGKLLSQGEKIPFVLSASQLARAIDMPPIRICDIVNEHAASSLALNNE